MPRPPLLPIIDWSAVIEKGRSFEEWLAASSSSNCATIQKQTDDFRLKETHQNTLARIVRPVYVVAIAETWCGDVVRHIPVLEALSRSNSSVQTCYIKREDDAALFGRYLTNGGEAIPKFIFLNEQLVECGNWGPMPQSCKDVIARGKSIGGVGAARAKVSELYHQDSACDQVVEELMYQLDIAGSGALE